MSLQNAHRLLDWMYIGNRYELTVEIEDENNDPYPMYSGDVVFLTLARLTEDNVVLEIAGDIIADNDNKVEFILLPAHTESLMAGDYYLSIVVLSPEGHPWTALKGKFGLVPYGEGVV